MSEPFVGEIRMFAGNFAPRGWAFCDGQILAVSQNDALFSLYGTIYGGDGRTSFGLPDLRGRIPIHQGDGPGLSFRRLGSKAGGETETLTTSQMANHNHTFNASTATGTSNNAQGLVLGESIPGFRYLKADAVGAIMPFSNVSVGNTGGSRAHTNLQPTLCINFIVALVGIYPSRT